MNAFVHPPALALRNAAPPARTTGPVPTGRLTCLPLLDAAGAALRDIRTDMVALSERLRVAEEEREAEKARGESVARLATDYVRAADERVAAALRRVEQIETENRFLLDLAGRGPD